MRHNKYILFFLFLFLSPYYSTSQPSDGYLEDVKLILNEDGVNLDTLYLKRSYGTFWYGPIGGVNGNIDIGELKLLRKPWLPYSDTNKHYFNYLPEFGAGNFFGGMFEWQPMDQIWGLSLRAYILDSWSSTAYSEKYTDDIETQYDNTTNFTYLTISPAGKFYLSERWHVFGGVDVAINLSYESLLIRKHTNVGKIKHDYEYEFNEINMRFGGHAGIAFEFEIADINQRLRLKAEPFASIHVGTAMVTDDGSSWNTITARIGIALKIGPDEIEYDTARYVPVEELPPVILASLDRKMDLGFPEINLEAFALSTTMAGVEGGLVEERLDFEPVITLSLAGKPDILRAVEEKADIAFAGLREPKEKPGEKIEEPELIEKVDQKFSFTKSSSTELTIETKKYLDHVAVYLKNNPGATLGITGHSDNQGSFGQNDKRARDRAEEVKQYLMRRGIPSARLLAGGKGSIEPIASNKTEAGRRKNRRVEVRIVPAPPRAPQRAPRRRR